MADAKLELVHTVDPGGDKVLAVAFHPSKAQVAVGTRDGVVSLVDADSGAVLRRMSGHREFVYCLAWHPQGELVLSSGKDTTMRVWHAESGSFREDWSGIVRGAGARTRYGSMQVQSGAGHTKTPLSVAFSEDGQYLGSGGQDHLVKLWKEGRALRTFNWHGGPVTAVAFRPGTAELLSGSRDGTLRTWDPDTGSMIHKYLGHADEIEAAVWLDGQRFASADVSGALHLWSESSEKPEASVQEDAAVRCLAASRDGALVYAGLETGDLVVRSTATGRRASQARLLTVEAHDMAVRSLSMSADGKLLASGGNDGRLHLWKTGA